MEPAAVVAAAAALGLLAGDHGGDDRCHEEEDSPLPSDVPHLLLDVVLFRVSRGNGSGGKSAFESGVEKGF